MSQFHTLIEIMARLRSSGGCPWDREQTHQSLKPYLIEETYEVIDALESGTDADIAEELGDLMLQVVFHAQIAKEEGRFTIEDVVMAISEKLIRRHPHVFGDVKASTSEQVLVNWQKIKIQEKSKQSQKTSILSGVPRHLPALHRAQQLQEKAARAGFDWENISDVANKVQEEVQEFLSAYQNENREHCVEEFGDLLFALVNLARFLNINPEEALTQCNNKFQKRFSYIESELQKQGKTPPESTLSEMDALWEQAKTKT